MSTLVSDRPAATPAMPPDLAGHMAMLKERVFQTETRWPQFNRLLTDLPQIASSLPKGAKVVALERTILYGGISLFAPFFREQEFVSVDCSPAEADVRGAYNAHMVDDPRTIRIPYSRRGTEVDTGLADGFADVVLVPNLVHHIADQQKLVGEMARVVKPGGQVYVFEPIVRELHQIPEDYLRYTPFGLAQVMEGHQLRMESYELEGGPFQAIAYCWDQALQYFPADKRPEMERWFFTEHFPQLMKWDVENPNNLVRKHTSFPVAFSLLARKIG